MMASESDWVSGAGTAACNAAPHIAQTVESVPAQACPDFDYIDVDDGSSDGTVQIVARSAPRVIVSCQKIAGAGAARNRGLDRAPGDHVAMVDADDLTVDRRLAPS